MNQIGNLEIVTRSELLAMLQLVRHANKEDWEENCIVNLEWDKPTAEFVINKLHKMANRELAE